MNTTRRQNKPGNEQGKVVEMMLGEIIRQYVKANGITYRDFAKRTGLTSGYISMLVNNRNPKTGKPIAPTVETFVSIAKAMGIGMDELLVKMNGEQAKGNPHGRTIISERLEAIAEALEIASKQVRLLKEEVDILVR